MSSGAGGSGSSGGSYVNGNGKAATTWRGIAIAIAAMALTILGMSVVYNGRTVSREEVATMTEAQIRRLDVYGGDRQMIMRELTNLAESQRDINRKLDSITDMVRGGGIKK